MTNFTEIQFPSDISYGATGGPMYLTDIVATVSGYEQRNSRWEQARAKYNVASGIKTEAQWQELIAFFRARRGKAVGFRFKDWSDYTGANELIGEGDGSTQTFQLKKLYTSNVTVERIITKPVWGSVKIYLDSVLQTFATDYTVNHATGVVSMVTAPGNGVQVTADYEFDVPVRFDTDELDLSMDSFNAGSWQSIPLIEVRI